MPVNKHLAEFFGLTIRLAIGAVLFVVIYMLAVGIAWIIHHSQDIVDLPSWLPASAKWVEMVIYGVDVFLGALFLLREVIGAVRAFISDMKAG